VDVGAWLRELDLEQYEAAFRANDVDAELLPSAHFSHASRRLRRRKHTHSDIKLT